MSFIISSAGQQFVAGGSGGGGSGEGFPLTSNVSAAGFRIGSLGDAAGAGDAVSRGFADARYLLQDGSTPLTGFWDVGNQPIVNINQLAVGVALPDDDAILQLNSTTQGFLPPRMSEAQRDAIVTPPDGLTIYNNDNKRIEVRSSSWLTLATSLIVGEQGASATYYGGSIVGDVEQVNASGVLATHYVQHDVDTSGGPLALELPTAATVGAVHVIQDATGDAATNPITVTDEGGTLINGEADYVITTAWGGRAFRKVAGNNWVSAL